ncbi:MAG: fructose-6-phosphate aldolase [Gemmatimonadota bacterium]|nr:MAG: fructose-6-phosphate aldolase [Gemmatimonadota bacterium]
MKIFIDTANVSEIREAVSLGIIDGVTTNPTLLSKEKGTFREILIEICSLVDGPISAEVVSEQSEGMVEEARELAKIGKNITIKVPMSTEGMKAVTILSQESIWTNMTLVFSPSQAILAAKAGARFISPFVGRVDDMSHFGMDSVRQIVTIYENYGFDTEIIVASIRHPLHVVEAALAGAHIATVPFKVIQQLVKHPLTDIGIKRFQEDWEKVTKKTS